MCALLIGTGLGRFAYTPLIPALVAAHWFTPGAAAYLGAANLAGYLVGSLLARTLAAPCGVTAALRASMAVATLAFFACAAPLSFAWMFLWRFAAGLAGAVLMVMAAPLVLPHVPPARRGLAGGVIFTGVGLGIAASGSLVPLLLRAGLVAAWCGLGGVALVLTILAWGGWPDAAAPIVAVARERKRPPALWWISTEYALNAAGLVPHMIFLVDFVARGLGQGVAAGARYWVLFGIGAMAGPVVLGRIADRIGFAAAVRGACLIEAVLVGALAVSADRWTLALSSLVIGAFVPGITTLVLGRVREIVGHDIGAQQAAWSIATTAFALGQAAAAYGFSFLFARSGSYALLFALGAAALVLAIVLDLHITARLSPPRPR
jgi:predicted MFS family arabinose efflux permease